MRRIETRIDANHIAGVSQRGAPDRPVGRAHGDRIQTGDDALVLLCRVDRLVGLDIVVPFAIAVGVENEGRPALRFLLVAGLLEGLAIEPADDRGLRTAGAGLQRLVGVRGEVQMVRREAGADQGELAGRRVVHRQMAIGL
jgi:hypothetical protein